MLLYSSRRQTTQCIIDELGRVPLNLRNLPNFENRKFPKTESTIIRIRNSENRRLFQSFFKRQSTFAPKLLLALSPDPFVECLQATSNIVVSFELKTENLSKVSDFDTWTMTRLWYLLGQHLGSEPSFIITLYKYGSSLIYSLGRIEKVAQRLVMISSDDHISHRVRTALLTAILKTILLS